MDILKNQKAIQRVEEAKRKKHKRERKTTKNMELDVEAKKLSKELDVSYEDALVYIAHQKLKIKIAHSITHTLELIGRGIKRLLIYIGEAKAKEGEYLQEQKRKLKEFEEGQAKAKEEMDRIKI